MVEMVNTPLCRIWTQTNWNASSLVLGIQKEQDWITKNWNCERILSSLFLFQVKKMRESLPTENKTEWSITAMALETGLPSLCCTRHPLFLDFNVLEGKRAEAFWGFHTASSDFLYSLRFGGRIWFFSRAFSILRLFWHVDLHSSNHVLSLD